MKRLSIQLKLTLWFTAVMILLTLIMLGFTSLTSNSVAQKSSRAVLYRVMEDLADEVDYDDGELEIDKDFQIYEDNVYSLLAKADGSVITGYMPAEELMQIPFEEGVLKEIRAEGELYYLLDRRITFPSDPDLWMRSVIPVSGRTINVAVLRTAVLIMLPVFIFLAAVGGYLLARPFAAADPGRSAGLQKRWQRAAI